MEEVKVSLDWCGYPARGAYWWDNKRTRPKIPPLPGYEELVKAWAAVRGTVDIPSELSPSEAQKLVRTTLDTDAK